MIDFGSNLRQNRSQDVRREIFLIAQTVGTTLDDCYFVVQPLDEGKGDLVFWLAVGGDAVPVSLVHLGELLVRLQALPRQSRPSVLEELEGLLVQVGGVQARIRRQRQRQVLLRRAGEVLRVWQDRVFLPLDETALLALDARVLGLADLVERLPKMLHHVELVEQYGCLGGALVGGVAKWLPHIHGGESDGFGLLFAQKPVELVHGCLASVIPAEPDRPAALQVAHHDAIVAALVDRDLIHPDGLRSQGAYSPDLFAQVVHFQPHGSWPVQAQLSDDVRDCAASAAPAHIQGEALRVQRILEEKIQLLALHCPAPPAVDPTYLLIEANALTGAGQILHPTAPAVVATAMHCAIGSADRFVSRRTWVTSRAPGSPNNPWTRCKGRKPGNRYSSANRRRVGDSRIMANFPPSATSPRPYEKDLAS